MLNNISDTINTISSFLREVSESLNKLWNRIDAHHDHFAKIIEENAVEIRKLKYELESHKSIELASDVDYKKLAEHLDYYEIGKNMNVDYDDLASCLNIDAGDIANELSVGADDVAEYIDLHLLANQLQKHSGFYEKLSAEVIAEVLRRINDSN